MRRLILLTLCLLLGARLPLVGQGELIVMSYNVENLFDLEDHPERADDEFLPMGSHRWTKARYDRKLHQIAEVLSSAGSLTHFPDLVALVEVENAGVLRDLLRRAMPSPSQRVRIPVGSMSPCSIGRRPFACWGEESSPYTSPSIVRSGHVPS